jgi:hypothetical protein
MNLKATINIWYTAQAPLLWLALYIWEVTGRVPSRSQVTDRDTRARGILAKEDTTHSPRVSAFEVIRRLCKPLRMLRVEADREVSQVE